MSNFYIDRSHFCINYSDWIMIWFILYKFKIVNYNPKFSVIAGIIQNVSIIITLLIKQEKKPIRETISRYIHIIIKFIMFYLLLDTSFTKHDFIANIILFILYNIWLYLIHNKTFIEFNKSQKNNNLEGINENYKFRLDKARRDYKNNKERINNNYKNILNKYNICNNIDSKINKNLN